MNKYVSRILLTMLCVPVLAISEEPTSSTNHGNIVSGQISDWQGKPISDVTLTFTDKNNSVLLEVDTDKNGQYVSEIKNWNAPIKISVAKKGYGSFYTMLEEPRTINLTMERCLPPYFTLRLQNVEGEKLQSTVVEMLTSSDWDKADLKRELFKMEEHLRVPMNRARQNSGLLSRANDWLVFVGELAADNVSVFKNMMAPPRVIENVDLAACIQDAGLMIIEKNPPEYEFRIDHVVFNKSLTKTFVQCAAYGGPMRGSGYDLCFTKIDGKWILTAYKHTWVS